MEPGDISKLSKPLDRVLGWLEQGAAWVRDRFVRARAVQWQRDVVSQPIPNPDVFEGRADDLRALGELFASRNVVWVTGPPGIGKSWLVGKFLWDAGLDDRACSFELGVDAHLQDLLESLNSFLLDRQCPVFDRTLRQPGLRPAQRIPALLRALGQTDLVLVVESYEEVRDDAGIAELLREAEEHLSGAKLVVTSQQPPVWPIEERRRHLGGLQPDESKRLLEGVGVIERWQEIHDAIGGCPKGLRVAAGLAKRYGVEEALGAARRGERPALGLFEEVYARATESARRMWVMLGMLPGPYDREIVLELWADDDGASRWAELLDCSVLDPRGDRWQMHSLARGTAGKDRAGQRGWPKEYGRKIARCYAQFAKDKASDRAVLESELENLLAAARLAFQYREWEALWGMGYALEEPLTYPGRWTAREELLRLCAEGAARARDRGERAAFTHNLGTALQVRGKLEEAEGRYQESLEIAREVGNRPQEATTLHNLGGVAQARGKLEEAEGRYQQSLEIAREVGDRPGEAATLHQLGMVSQDRGKLEEALYRQSLEIEREVGDRPGEAKTLHQLGIVAQDRGKLEEAEALYRQSLEIEREVGDRPGETGTLHQLGNVAYLRGKLEEAEGLYQQSLEIKRAVGDRPGEARTIAQMALLAEAQGDPRLAVARMQEAHRRFAEMGLAETEAAKEHLDRLRRRAEEEGGG